MDVAEFTLKLRADTAEATRQIKQDMKTLQNDLKSFENRPVHAPSPPLLSNLQRLARARGVQSVSAVENAEHRIIGSVAAKTAKIQALRNMGMHEEANKLAGIERPASSFEMIGKGLHAAGIDLGYTKLVELGAVAAGVAAGVMAVSMAFDAVKFSIESVVSVGWELGKMLLGAVSEALAFTQQSQLAFGMLLDNASQGVSVFDQVRKEAVDLGMDVDVAVDSFRKLLAAQFSVGQANELIKVSADLQAIGASATDVKHALLAISQIKMKGKLQAEELTRQLANAGVSSELVYQALQKRLNIPMTKAGRDKVMKLQKTGQISADVAIPAIIDAIQMKVHESASGVTAKQRASSTIPGMQRQAKGMVQNAFIDIAKDIEQPVTAAVGKIFDSFKRFMDSPVMDQLKDSIAGVFINAAGFIEQYWPQVEPVIVGVGQKAVEFFRDVGAYISDHGDEIAAKIGQIARVSWALGSAMVTVTGWAFELGDALLSIANFFDQHPLLTKLLIAGGSLVMAPFTGGLSLLAGGAALGLGAGIEGLPSGPLEGPINNLTRNNTSGGLEDLVDSIDKQKTGMTNGAFGPQQAQPKIGSVTNHLSIQSLDLSDPELAGNKILDVVNRGMHRSLEDTE